LLKCNLSLCGWFLYQNVTPCSMMTLRCHQRVIFFIYLSIYFNSEIKDMGNYVPNMFCLKCLEWREEKLINT